MADLLSELRALKQALDEGLLTQDEHDRRKRKLLGEDELLAIPNRLGSYVIFEEIGRGGMGIVYRGRHRTAAFAERQGGDVAIKRLHEQYAREAHFRDRFEREAAVGIKLDHPGIVRVFELVQDGEQVALVMEWVEGQPLSKIIGTVTGPVPWERAAPMVSQLLTAVRYAHGQGVIHRDLKPENVMWTDKDRLKILDFGIAKDLGSDRTQTGTRMGTIDYMAPEQYLDAKSVDHRADIYALGMTLYEMLAGRLPWSSDETEFRILERKKNGQVPPPTDFYPDIPSEIVDAVMTCIQAEKSERPADIPTLIERLKAAHQASESSPTRPEDTARKQNLYSEFRLLKTQARDHFSGPTGGPEQREAMGQINALIHRFETEAGFPKHPTDTPSREVQWGYREMEALVADLRIKLAAAIRSDELRRGKNQKSTWTARTQDKIWPYFLLLPLIPLLFVLIVTYWSQI